MIWTCNYCVYRRQKMTKKKKMMMLKRRRRKSLSHQEGEHRVGLRMMMMITTIHKLVKLKRKTGGDERRVPSTKLRVIQIQKG
jgi:hypothetical protein